MGGVISMCVSTGTVDDAARIATIRTTIAEIRTAVAYLDGESASRTLADITSVTAELESLRLQLVSRIEASEIWRNDPNGTANSWLRSHHKLDHRSAQSDLRAAHALAAYPSLREAADLGDISRAHVDAIVGIGEANEVRRRHLGEFVQIFIDVARRQPVSVLKTVLRAWADQIDPLGVARDEHEAHSRRYLHVNMVADGVHIEGFFSKHEGSKVIAALNAALTTAHRRRRDIPKPGDGGAGSETRGDGGGETRGKAAAELESDLPILSSAQQRADAFIAGIIDPLLASDGLPTTGGSRPAVTVIVPLERLEQPCDADPRVARTKREEEATTSDGLPFVRMTARIGVTNGPSSALVSADAAKRLTCDCEVHRVIINPAGLPLDVGRTMRTIPPHIRRALVVRDGGCVFPHCDRPPGWTEAHHIVHWAQGGVTSLDNTVLLCSKHHHAVHSEGHRIDVSADGRVSVTVRHSRARQ